MSEISPHVADLAFQVTMAYARQNFQWPTAKRSKHLTIDGMKNRKYSDEVDDLGRRVDARTLLDVFVKAPSDSWFDKKLQEWKKNNPLVRADDQWNSGTLTDVGLGFTSSDMGALLTIWSYSLSSEENAGFTIRQAQWVSRLRHVPQAGGSESGHITDAEMMYRVSSAYTAKERLASDQKTKLDTTALDALLQLKPAVMNLAIKAGFTNLDDGSYWLKEIALYNPELAKSLETRSQMSRGKRPALVAGQVMLNGIQQLFDQQEKIEQLASGRSEDQVTIGDLWSYASQMLSFGLSIARKDPRYDENIRPAKQLALNSTILEMSDKAHSRFFLAMAMNLYDVYIQGGEAAWMEWGNNVPLDKIFDDFTNNRLFIGSQEP